MGNLIEFNTDQMEPPAVGNDLYENRASVVAARQTADVEVSIMILAYNRLEKTRRCVESVLDCTGGINYELILMDNGSTDGTLEYFKAIPYEQKKIIHITKNLSPANAFLGFSVNDFAPFICSLSNDLIVTPHWMENLLLCIKSDPKIGIVNPVSSNVSNLQEVTISYQSGEEMRQKAARFNRSDPRKWEDRQRLITLGTLYRKEVLLAGGWPVSDMGFFHDFSDDDMIFAVRRLGYRTVLAGDTWICHDHDLRSGEGKDPAELQKSLEIGRANFREKYFGLDAWDDVNNYYSPYFNFFPAPHVAGGARILGVDVRCGTPILDLKNWLRKAGIFNVELSAFTQDPKYWVDLKTICGGQVCCDREEFLSEAFLPGYFDYVIADQPLNRCHEPQRMLTDMFSLCKQGGIVVCKLKNAFSFKEFIHLLGQRDVYDPEFSYNIPVDTMTDFLGKFGTIHSMISIPYDMDQESRQVVDSLIPAELPQKQREDILNKMLCREYMFVIENRCG